MKALFSILVTLLFAAAATADWTEAGSTTRCENLSPGDACEAQITGAETLSVVNTEACTDVHVWVPNADGGAYWFQRCNDLDGTYCRLIKNKVGGVLSQNPFDGTDELGGQERVQADFVTASIDTLPNTLGVLRIECD